MTYILATANEGKIREMREILSEFDIDIVTREDMGITIDVEETGTTFLENATIKASAICNIANMPAIADDSGLCVDVLDGDPGVYTSSYGGEELSHKERYMYLLSQMKDTRQRSAKFVSTIVCAYPDGRMLAATGECLGTIATEPRGDGGFGYDPVFIPDGKSKTMGEMPLEEKNKISHRAKALKNFAKLLEGEVFA